MGNWKIIKDERWKQKAESRKIKAERLKQKSNKRIKLLVLFIFGSVY